MQLMQIAKSRGDTEKYKEYVNEIRSRFEDGTYEGTSYQNLKKHILSNKNKFLNRIIRVANLYILYLVTKY